MSALPTQAAHGLPVALPLPLPLPEGEPLRSEVYWLLGEVSLAPWPVLSALDGGWTGMVVAVAPDWLDVELDPADVTTAGGAVVGALVPEVVVALSFP